MTDDLARLTQLAQAATPGPWTVNLSRTHSDWVNDVSSPGDEHGVFCAGHDYDDCGLMSLNNANYIAALSPDVLLRLVARLRRVEQAATWHPIETAPKDGTAVFVYCARGDYHAVAEWKQYLRCWVDGRVACEPNLWMPIPVHSAALAPAPPTPEGETR